MASPAERSRSSLGADRALGTVQVTLFVPSVDRDTQKIDQPRWVEAALETFGRLFRGATAFPPGRGVWRDDERGGKLAFDDTVMVTSYVAPELFDQDAVLAELRRFLHRMGQDARQGEIGLVVDGSYLGITRYDAVGGQP